MALVAGILRFVIPPRAVAGQIFQQMLPHIFVLRADQPQAQQKRAERKGRVIADRRFVRQRFLLVDRLRRDRHGQHDVGLDLTRVQRSVEQPKLDRAVVEHRMQIESVMLSST